MRYNSGGAVSRQIVVFCKHYRWAMVYINNARKI